MAWESKTKIFGLPLVSAGGNACGVFAFGFMGTGIFTIAQFGTGIIAITQFGVGIVSISQFGAGFFTVGQFALGLIFGFGQFALGFISVGLKAVGYYSADNSYTITRQFEVVQAEILEDPAALIYWSIFLSIIMIYLFFQRDKIVPDMSFWDIFQSKLKHSNPMIRRKGIKEITDQKKLFDIFNKDRSGIVKKAAIRKINDTEILLKISKGSYSNELKTIAIKKINNEMVLKEIVLLEKNKNITDLIISRINNTEMFVDIAINAGFAYAREKAVKSISDQALLKKIALVSESNELSKIIISKINDQIILEEILKSSALTSVKLHALKKINTNDDKFLSEIVLGNINVDICNAAIKIIKDQEIIAEIAISHNIDKIRETAINKLDNKKLLHSLFINDKNEIIRLSAKNRLHKIRPLYYMLKLQIDCPYCSQPIIINGPMLKTKCSSCTSIVKIHGRIWKKVLKAGPGITKVTSMNNLLIDKRIEPPACSNCGQYLETDDVPVNSSKDLKCDSCGNKNLSSPLPLWFKWARYGEHIFCAEKEGEEYKRDRKIKPVAISCIKCGAPLTITVDTPRNATCAYCNTVQYLPDPLWLSLHPVKIKQAWYIRFNYRASK